VLTLAQASYLHTREEKSSTTQPFSGGSVNLESKFKTVRYSTGSCHVKRHFLIWVHLPEGNVTFCVYRGVEEIEWAESFTAFTAAWITSTDGHQVTPLCSLHALLLVRNIQLCSRSLARAAARPHMLCKFTQRSRVFDTSAMAMTSAVCIYLLQIIELILS